MKTEAESFFPRFAANPLPQWCQSLIEDRGWGFWAVQCKNRREFVGY
jgi:hypothetical protein